MHFTLDEFRAASVADHLGLFKAEAIQRSYDEGKELALRWKDTWHPGGPTSFPPTRDETGLIREYFQLTVDCYASWHKGFDESYEASGNQCITGQYRL